MTTALAGALLAWYDRHRRVMPWRARSGERADPYRVWLAEIMLQQTTVATVGPYFERFVKRWPNVAALAAAPREDVLHAWAGLGYYARARNLHACAKAVADSHGGVFPDTEEGLLELPGVGPYTAAAIAAIAFGRPSIVIDGNVERVMTRVFAIDTPLPKAKIDVRAAMADLVPVDRPGDFAQATMDLGATICSPRRPKCMLCPWEMACRAHAAGEAERYPVKLKRAKRPLKRAIAYVLTDRQGAVWLRRRADDGLLGGMMEVPSSEWAAGEPSAKIARAAAPAALAWRELPEKVRHGFTHFELELTVWTAQARRADVSGGQWVAADGLDAVALPTLMRKVIARAIARAKGTSKKRRPKRA
ncbi:MAG: A/G-specific adenine glycosylase [Alphaproteobacteria bacterium]|nr:A/G-specific adenine glycosylase [Alphaproteobacteria bacterium]